MIYRSLGRNINQAVIAVGNLFASLDHTLYKIFFRAAWWSTHGRHSALLIKLRTMQYHFKVETPTLTLWMPRTINACCSGTFQMLIYVGFWLALKDWHTYIIAWICCSGYHNGDKAECYGIFTYCQNCLEPYHRTYVTLLHSKLWLKTADSLPVTQWQLERTNLKLSWLFVWYFVCQSVHYTRKCLDIYRVKFTE